MNTMNDAIVTGLLVKLHSENKVEQCGQENRRGGWRLTDKEFSRRRDDIEQH